MDDEFITMASWYGPGFHGRPTASGQRFDQNKLTAAHRSLPFGTNVTVKNVRNGRTCDVVINDRGPHVRGRGIDLSAAAAKRIGILGVGPVVCYINDPNESPHSDAVLKSNALEAPERVDTVPVEPVPEKPADTLEFEQQTQHEPAPDTNAKASSIAPITSNAGSVAESVSESVSESVAAGDSLSGLQMGKSSQLVNVEPVARVNKKPVVAKQFPQGLYTRNVLKNSALKKIACAKSRRSETVSRPTQIESRGSKPESASSKSTILAHFVKQNVSSIYTFPYLRMQMGQSLAPKLRVAAVCKPTVSNARKQYSKNNDHMAEMNRCWQYASIPQYAVACNYAVTRSELASPTPMKSRKVSNASIRRNTRPAYRTAFVARREATNRLSTTRGSTRSVARTVKKVTNGVASLVKKTIRLFG
jgi:rare lipoprotein A (peptidoglycan hydrolase)